MRIRTWLALGACCSLMACGGGTNDSRAVPAPPATNDNGNPTTATVTANFDPTATVIPLPNNLLLADTNDLTLNIPFDPSSAEAPLFEALNALDGWGTLSPWSTSFNSPLDPASVVPGDTVRWFEVEIATPGGPVTGVVRELTPGVDYTAVVGGNDPNNPNVLLVPLRPLDEITTYMAVLTDGITDPQGNNATPAQVYFLAQRTSPLVNAQGQSTDPLIDNATAAALEPLRQLTNAQEAAAGSAGIASEDIVISWTATTQGITPVLLAAYSQVQPQFSLVSFSGFNTSLAGGAGVADIYIGATAVPYYLDALTGANPTGPLTGNWEAAPGAYVPPFDGFGFDPTSTNITYLNPFPVAKSNPTIPLLMTVPNAGSGQARPASGWPVVIFQHGITRQRTDMLALADSMALAGFAVVAIDLPLHGISSTVDASTGQVIGPEANPLYIENTPVGIIANERTFDADYVNNLTGAPGSDGFPDGSGTHFINLSSLLTSRDNLRQCEVDLASLAATVPTMDIDGDGLPDLDGSQIRFVGTSMGAICGVPFLAIDPTVSTGVVNVGGGGLVGLLLGSPTFSTPIINGLAAAGVTPGTDNFDLFVLAAQTITDSGDPMNYAALAAATNNILVQEVVGSETSLTDQVVPNRVDGFPLSGTEPLIRQMGLSPITSSIQSPTGIRGVTRFVVGDHGSLLSPAASLEATIEMQTQAASMAVSGGLAVEVAIPSVLQGN